VLLDTTTTPELEAEGLARDLIRAVQQARRTADFDVSDRIRLSLGVDEEAERAVEAHRDLIMSETLTTQLEVTLHEGVAPEEAVGVGSGSSVTVQVQRHE
jgi:isoleucyl-tRNA synthetase